jgi:two-component system, NarL family, nitrate/nitrite response regulator NarL
LNSNTGRAVILAVGCARALAESLERSLTWDPPGEVIGANGTAEQLVRVVLDCDPDIVLIDWSHPEIFRLVQALDYEDGRPVVVALDVEPREDAVIPLAEAGVSAFVWRDSSLGNLERTLLEVMHGEVSCPPSVTAALLRHVAATAPPTDDGEPLVRSLTRRELQIVELIGDRLSNKEIARRLGIAPQTVKNHVHNLLQKLGVDGRDDAAARIRAARARRPRERRAVSVRY